MYSFSLFYRQKRTKQSKRQVYRNTQKQCGEEAQKETIRLTHPLFVRLASYRFPDFVEKVGRTSGKILATRVLKPEKTTGVLRNVLIICSGSYFQGSADKESFMTELKKPFVASIKKRATTVVSGRSVGTGHFQYMETPCKGTKNRHSQHCFVR